MGSNCSSGRKDRDSISTRSEESPSYQSSKKVGEDKLRKKSTETHKIQSANGDKKSPSEVRRPSGVGIGAGVVLGVNIPKAAQSNHTRQSSLKIVGGGTQNRLLDQTIRQEDSLIDPIQAKIPKLVLYVCTADSQDFKVEKSQLHTEAANELRLICSNRGFELYLVDLHWSVQDKAVEPEELCLKELTRQSEYYIVPIVFLDSTLGEQLLPKNVESADFESVIKSDEEGLLKKWYKLDDNAQPPCYTLLPPATHIPELKDENKEKGLNLWHEEKNAILSTLLASFSQELRDTYLTTTVEREVQHTVLISQELAKRCVWFTRGTGGLGKSQGNEESTGEVEMRRRLEALQKTLKNELPERNITTLTSEHSAASDLVKILKRVINEVMDDHESKFEAAFETHMLKQDNDQDTGGRKKTDGKDDLNLAWSRWPAILERSRQLDRAWVIARWSVERRLLIDALTKQSGSEPILLVGPRGSGKTTTLSKFLLRSSGPSSSVYLTFRSALLTSSSIDLESILRSLIDELNPSEYSLSHDVNSLAKQFIESLACLSTRENCGKRQFYVCIDGLDDLGGEVNVHWVPKQLPGNVSLILSCREDGPYFARLKDNVVVVNVHPLNEEEAQSVFTTSFLEYNRDVSKEIQERAFKMLNSCRLPLYVKVTAWLFAVSDKFDVVINYKEDLNGQLEEMLVVLEQLLGRDKVERCLSLILASRWGLRDSEMIDLLAEDDLYRNSMPRAGAILFWTELVRVLGLYMFLETSAHSGAIRLKDAALVELAGTRYSKTIQEAARRLLKYFDVINEDSKAESTRKYEEILQLTRKSGGNTRELWQNLGFLVRLIRSVGVYQLLKDLRDEALVESSEFLEWLVRFIANSAESLTSDVAQLRTQLERHFHLTVPCQVLPKSWRDELLTEPGEAYLAEIHCAKDEPEDSPASLDIIRRLTNLKNHVVGVKSSLGEISVYDVTMCKKVRNLTGLTQPAALEMIDDYKCVVLCNRELMTYDLDKGVLLTKLKGMMNQKMPYFGLHDSNHLVALSRNRMYVNLMNLDTGDCVTTFKAGEDRFLNSLLVSADGKTLVCGDETQKPFPLLVWNLASRKLLYDLRIPQHEFISRLSAITPQGNFVCCVAKEVDDSSPNYIVVYDLQSGTLFKKWKPSVGTTSIDISHAESLLVSGHVNCKILCWSLGTGNCLHCLTGHTAPVDHLRLSPDGRMCLSMNSKGLDRSVRIWDLSQGHQIAVFTPDAPVTACELTNRWVLLSVKNQPRLICLEMRGGSKSHFESEKETYGR